MKKGWKIIGILVLVVIILGGICAGVGMMTGAEFDRIYDVLDAKYNLTILYRNCMQYLAEVKEAFISAGFTF